MGTGTARVIARGAAAVVLAIAVARCGGGPSSPSGSGTAVIAGTIDAVAPFGAVTGAPLGGLLTPAPRLGHDPGTALTGVLLLGTIIGSEIDARNRFELTDVAPGDRQLQFIGPTVNAILPVRDVKSQERIELGVNLNPASVDVVSIVRLSGSTASAEGRIDALPPTTAANALRVAGTTIIVSGSTRISRGSATIGLGELVAGQRVTVRGSASGDSISASTIAVTDTTTDTMLPAHGTLSNFQGSVDSFSFDVGRYRVRGDGATVLVGGGFDRLANGVRVEVSGIQRDGYLYAVRIVIE